VISLIIVLFGITGFYFPGILIVELANRAGRPDSVTGSLSGSAILHAMKEIARSAR
jgi:hypothetical protein